MTIKILYVIDKMVRAGAQMNLYQIASSLDETEFQPRLCCLLRRGDLADEMEERGIKVTSLELANIMGRRFGKAVGGVFRLARREKIDLIHSYLFAANIVAPWAGFFSGVPVITGRGDTGFWKKSHHIWANRCCNLLTERITANSQAVVDYLLRREKAKREKVVLIHKGWYAGPAEEKKDFTAGKFVLGCLGNIRPVKGYEYLLAALRDLERSRIPFEVHFGGRILDPVYFERLQKMAAHPSLREKIFFRGEISEVDKFLNELDVLIIPSLSEGFPNVLLEAMAKKLVVVATGVGAAREVIKDGIDGFLVPPADPKALSKIIWRMIQNPGVMENVGERARRKVIDEYSEKKMVREFQNLYRKVLNRR